MVRERYWPPVSRRHHRALFLSSTSHFCSILHSIPRFPPFYFFFSFVSFSFFSPRFLPFVAVFCFFRFSSPRRRFVRNTLEAYGVSMAEMYSVPTQTTTVFAETNDTPAENALTKTAECLSNGWVSDWWFWKRGCWARGFFLFFYRVSRDITALLRLPFILGWMLLRRFTCILR